MALPDRAANILPTLVNERRLSSGRLIFICHSLGGLVVKGVLRHADSLGPHDAAIADFLQRVGGVVFIGTPHAGSGLATIGNTFRRLIRPREAAAGLSRNDPHLRSLNTWFRSYSATHELKVLVLTETKKTKLIGLISSHVVPADSADPGLDPATRVIPLDEDHLSIVAPRDRTAEMYQHVREFVSQTFSGRHRDTRITDSLALVTDRVAAVAGELTSDIRTEAQQILGSLNRALAVQAAARTIENPIVTTEAGRRLWALRKSRFISGFDATSESKRLALDLIEGELLAASRRCKAVALAWCARILAANDVPEAERLLGEAKKIGACDEALIAGAFIQLFRDNARTEALGKLASLCTPLARSASLIVAAHGVPPSEALKWFESSGLATSDLDPDGKFAVIQGRAEIKQWDKVILDVRALTDADFEATPVLLTTAAMAHLSQAVHADFRSAHISHLPFDLKDFPLATDAKALEHRRCSQILWARAAQEIGRLAQVRVANLAADYSLWLALRDPSSGATARKQLEASMADPQHRLRRLPMALEFGLKPDPAAIEREIDRQTTLCGGNAPDAAIARFALATSKGDPIEIAAYIDKHRTQLEFYYQRSWILAIEVEMLSKGGQISDARQKLNSIDSDIISPEAIARLQRLIDEASGIDPISSREEHYKATGNLGDLLILVDLLRTRRSWHKLASYSRTLLDSTHEVRHAELCAEALYQNGQDSEILKLAEKYSDLLTLSEGLGTICAWASYRLGKLEEARRLLERLKEIRSRADDRLLAVNIAIASGEWSALAIFVESEWTEKAERSARELLRAAQIAHRIGSAARARQLVQEAAAKSPEDPGVLISCYSAAISAGWEDEPVVGEWLNNAIERSDENGPIKKMELRELLDMQPEWNDRRDRILAALFDGSMPMFAAARALNRSLLEMSLLPALSNLQEPDLRRRAAVFSFSGARRAVPIAARTVAFDATVILNLAFLGMLRQALDAFDAVFIAHSTMGWLFEECQRVEFHQPSRVKAALELKELIDRGYLRRLPARAQNNSMLELEVGEALSGLVAAAREMGTQTKQQRSVIRPYPISRLGSLIDEPADISGYEEDFAGCLDIVTSLKALGHLTEQEERRARSYLGLHERPWPHAPSISPGAMLFLDDLAVNYLQHVGLIAKLKPAGFTVFMATSEIDEADALARNQAFGGQVKAQIEAIRSVLASGIASGRVRLGPLSVSRDDPGAMHDPPDALDLHLHPTLQLLEILRSEIVRDVDAICIDDRFFNQHGNIESSASQRAVLTTLDILKVLEDTNRISTEDHGECITKLRRAAMMLVPHVHGEIAERVRSAPVVGGILYETAELRAIREAIFHVRMIDILQIPKEHPWLGDLLASLSEAIKAQWKADIPDSDSRFRATWLLALFDIRGWAHRLNPDPAVLLAAYRAQVLGLMLAPALPGEILPRYWKWLEDTILTPMRKRSESEFQMLLDGIQGTISEVAMRTSLPMSEHD
ncbi:hypothetical protein OL599_24310 [Rhodovastum sp. RN2-1]|uniref:HTH domain-containing protein n=2 Tax=Limobrevibacterium gyesilva TaxID=2991712 RepID=A0AA41YYQ1_9PROT|nr:hypothetical protein [Limobrevibacterium gyesilva]